MRSLFTMAGLAALFGAGSLLGADSLPGELVVQRVPQSIGAIAMDQSGRLLALGTPAGLEI